MSECKACGGKLINSINPDSELCENCNGTGKADSVELKDNELDESEYILIEIGKREMWEKMRRECQRDATIIDNEKLCNVKCTYDNCPIAKEGK